MKVSGYRCYGIADIPLFYMLGISDDMYDIQDFRKEND